MLTLMRGLLRSKLGVGVFLLVIVAMAGWGITDVFGGGLGNNLAGAGNRTLSDTEFDGMVERGLRNATDSQGRSLTKEQALEQGLIDQIFQREQFDLSLRAYADSVGVSATRQMIQDEIANDAVFQDTTGVFDPQRYAALLRDNGFTSAMYEADVESILTIERLQGVPSAGLRVPSVLARLQAAYSGEMRNASWFAIPSSSLPDIGEPTEEDLQALYEEVQERLREPERRAVSLIKLSVDDFTALSDIEEEDVTAFYQAYRPERYTGPDSRVFTDFQFADEAAARDALGRIAGGASADDIAGLMSATERSGQKETIANQRLADQVFSPNALPGGIYGPQQVGETWSVVRLEEILEGDITPFETVRDDIRDELARDQAIDVFYDALPRFDDLIGTGAPLETIAQDLGTPLLSFQGVDRRGLSPQGSRYTPLLETPELLDQIFSRAEGRNTDRLGDQEITYLARVDEIIEERMPELDEVRDRLIFTWEQRKLNEALELASAEVQARIRSGETTLAQEAEGFEAELVSLERPLTRTNFQANLPPALINGLFEARNEGDLLTAPGLPGQIIVMQVTLIDRPESETLDVLAGATAAGLQAELERDLSTAFSMAIQGETELKINASAYEGYKRSIAPNP
ncbi:MAG: SurA N-terminal domain-containing protein [Henriciella sp.]|nr:SurA N-terminal domain-containing protein [Henriciella sp.]